MKTDYMIKNHPVVFITAASFIAFYLLGLSGCQTLELEQEPEVVEALQNICYETGYYYYDEATEIYTVYDNNRKQIGYAFYAEGMGEGIPAAEGEEKVAGPIVILVGMEDEETIRDIFVISHSETRGVWDNLVNQDYLGQFEGLKISDAYLMRDGGQVDSVSGATLSSKLVLNTVRDTTLEKFKLTESEIEWQVTLLLAIVIPFVLIPVLLTWYTIIKQARAR